MKRLLALTWKEFLQLKRDRMTLRMIVIVPILQTLIFGYAINYDVKHLKTVVLDESRSYESRELVAKMTATEYFERRRPRRLPGGDATRARRRAAPRSASSSTATSARTATAARPAQAFLIVNASDTTTSSQAMSIMSGHRPGPVHPDPGPRRRAGRAASCPSTCGCAPGTTPTCGRRASSSPG